MKQLLAICLICGIWACDTSSTSTTATNNSQPATDTAVFSDSTKAAIDSIVYQLAATHHCRFTVKVTGDSNRQYYSGYDGREGKAINNFDGSIDIGSCTKMFTATAIIQLVEQHKLSLQDKLVDVLPNDTLYRKLLVVNGKDYIDSVHIYQLLNHSSGLPEYFIEGDDDKEIALHGDSSLRFTPYQLVGMSKQHMANAFVPGSKFKYCNLNYILLGMIIEKLSGKTYQQYVDEHILQPLHMHHTFFASLNSPANRAAGHFKGKVSTMPATLAGPAGEIISTLDDMTTFIRNWNQGKLFADSSSLQMLKQDYYLPMAPGIIDYGFGVIHLLQMSYGHAGQTFGFQTYMGVLPNDYSFVFGIDDAAIGAWEPAMEFSQLLSIQTTAQ